MLNNILRLTAIILLSLLAFSSGYACDSEDIIKTGNQIRFLKPGFLNNSEAYYAAISSPRTHLVIVDDLKKMDKLELSGNTIQIPSKYRTQGVLYVVSSNKPIEELDDYQIGSLKMKRKKGVSLSGKAINSSFSKKDIAYVEAGSSSAYGQSVDSDYLGIARVNNVITKTRQANRLVESHLPTSDEVINVLIKTRQVGPVDSDYEGIVEHGRTRSISVVGKHIKSTFSKKDIAYVKTGSTSAGGQSIDSDYSDISTRRISVVGIHFGSKDHIGTKRSISLAGKPIESTFSKAYILDVSTSFCRWAWGE